MVKAENRDGGEPGAPQAAPYKIHQLVGLFLGPLAFAAIALSPAPEGLTTAAWLTAALAAWMGVWWATEAIPLFVTALLPLVFLPLFGVLNIHAAAAPFANPVIFLLLGGFVIGLAVERWNLHRRIAFHIILTVGNSPRRLLAGIMLATFLVSLWISNTATTVMMLPIAISLIGAVLASDAARSRDADNFTTAMVLCVAYAATIGGMGTLIGSPPNALAASYLDQTFNLKVTFVDWMAIAVPISASILIAAYLIITRVSLPFSDALPGADRKEVAGMLAALGPLTAPEKRVAAVFAVVAAGWVLYPLVAARVGLDIGDTGFAIAGAIALFLIPADWRKRRFLLDASVVRRVPWDVLILFGGGLSLAEAIDKSGLAAWIGSAFVVLHDMPLIVLIGGLVLLVVFASELMSNTATAAAFLPLVASLVVGTDLAAFLFALPIALAASSAYMLPVGTVPNALVFGTGLIPLTRMMRAGFWLNLAGAALISGGVVLAARFL
ncbi:MAG TPA: SLC13 family permease [Methyloceanibacter sp.]|nr:SLC13 family permease [Methyloceanibacter sp.]